MIAGPHAGESAQPAASSRAATVRLGRLASGFRVVSLFTLGSRLLGLLRDMGMAALFGAGPLMDAFSVAFKVPNLARRLFGEGALTAAFLPAFVGELEREGTVPARRLATAVFITLGKWLTLFVVLAELAIGGMYWLSPPGTDTRLLLGLTAVMLPYTVLVCLSAQVSAVLQSLDKFAIPALSPVILNLLWIAAILMVPLLAGDPRTQIHLIALCVVLAGIVQLALPFVTMQQTDLPLIRHWRSAMPQVGRIVRAMLPVVLGLSITQLNTLVDSLLAWGLAASPGQSPAGFPQLVESGTASALYFAQRMYQFPLGVFGVALGTVLFPLLSRHAERGERHLMRHDLSLGLRLVAAVCLPASVGLVLLREPIAVLFFQRGAFTSADAALTARCIGAYGIGVWAYVGLLIIHRGFYALGDRRTPMVVGVWVVFINLLLNLLLVGRMAGAGLALATAVAAMVQMLWVSAAFHRRVGLLDIRSIARTAGRTLVTVLPMSAVCLAAMHWLPPGASSGSRLLALFVPMLAALAAYLFAGRLIRLEEPFLLLRRGQSSAESGDR